MKPRFPTSFSGDLPHPERRARLFGNRRRVLLLHPGLSRHFAAMPSRRLLGLRRIRAGRPRFERVADSRPS